MLIGLVVFVGIFTAAAGIGFQQVAVIVGSGLLVHAGGGDADQIAIFVIAHGLGCLTDKEDFVKPHGVGILFIGADHLDIVYCLGRLLGHDGQAGKLPLLYIRAERYIVMLLRAVGIAHCCPQAEALGGIRGGFPFHRV